MNSFLESFTSLIDQKQIKTESPESAATDRIESHFHSISEQLNRFRQKVTLLVIQEIIKDPEHYAVLTPKVGEGMIRLWPGFVALKDFFNSPSAANALRMNSEAEIFLSRANRQFSQALSQTLENGLSSPHLLSQLGETLISIRQEVIVLLQQANDSPVAVPDVQQLFSEFLDGIDQMALTVSQSKDENSAQILDQEWDEIDAAIRVYAVLATEDLTPEEKESWEKGLQILQYEFEALRGYRNDTFRKRFADTANMLNQINLEVKSHLLVSAWLSNETPDVLEQVSPPQLREYIYHAYRFRAKTYTPQSDQVDPAKEREAKHFLQDSLEKYQELISSQIQAFFSAYKEVWQLLQSAPEDINPGTMQSLFRRHGILFPLQSGVFDELSRSLIKAASHTRMTNKFIDAHHRDADAMMLEFLPIADRNTFKLQGTVRFNQVPPITNLTLIFSKREDYVQFRKKIDTDKSTNTEQSGGVFYPTPFDFQGLKVHLVATYESPTLNSKIDHERDHQMMWFDSGFRMHRTGEAEEKGVPKEAIFTDDTLITIPESLDPYLEREQRNAIVRLQQSWRTGLYDLYTQVLTDLRDEMQAYTISLDSLAYSKFHLSDRTPQALYNFLDLKKQKELKIEDRIDRFITAFASIPLIADLANALRVGLEQDQLRIQKFYDEDIKKAYRYATRIYEANEQRNNNHPTSLHMTGLLLRYTSVATWRYLGRYLE